MTKAYDVYNLEEDLDEIIEDISNEYSEDGSFVKECYEYLTLRGGFIDFVREHDDSLFYSCLFDLVSRRRLASRKIQHALIDVENGWLEFDEIYESYNIERIEESVDCAIYHNYGLDAKAYLTENFLKGIGFDEDKMNYEDFGVNHNGVRVLCKGGIPVKVKFLKNNK